MELTRVLSARTFAPLENKKSTGQQPSSEKNL